MFSDYIQSGDVDKICEFLETANLIEGEKGFNFSEILWMLKSKDMFARIINILKSRMIYDNSVWSYGFLHNDKDIIREYLQKNTYSISYYNGYFSFNIDKPSGEYISKLLFRQNSSIQQSLTFENIEFRHLDYYPLINARAHQLSDDVNQGILNREFRETYNRFLLRLAEKVYLDTEDMLNWTFYYLLQDKTKEAIEMYHKIDGSQLEEEGAMRIQYDYLGAYLDFYTGTETNFKVAREVAAKYADYPVLYWKGLFQEVHEQLQEYDGTMNLEHNIDQNDEFMRRENLKKSKNLAPILECHLDKKDIVIDYVNIDKVDIKYYVIDPELMFSKSPFISQNTDEFSYIKPLKVNTQELSRDLKSLTVAIDPEYQTQNLILEIIGGGKQAFLSYFSTELKVAINETFGELKVTDKKDNPLAQVYVKVYAKHKNGEVKFFRDGYTDIRGKLEYAHSSSGKLGSVEKFSVFIMSDELGSLTKECAPPSNVKKDRF